MRDTPPPNSAARQQAAGNSQPGYQSGIRNTKTGVDVTNGVSSRQLLIPTARKRLSDTSAVSTVTSSYQNRDHGITSVSQACSPRLEPRFPRDGSGQVWTPAPSPRGVKYVSSAGPKVLMTPRTAAYLRRRVQKSYVSWPTTARTMPVASTEVGEDAQEHAKSVASLEQFAVEEEREEVEARQLDEQPLTSAPRARRFPWIGPAYTAIHSPPYTLQTREFGRVESLLGRTRPKPLSSVEQYVIVNDLERLGPRQVVRAIGHPHPDPYPHRAPAPNSYLEDYPVPPPLNGHSFEKDPLLRSVLTPQDNFPYIREQSTYHGQPLNFWYNDWMLDNVMVTTTAQKYCPGTTSTYVDIPNFGRVQSVYMRQLDGTVYPLVTLPKMTPFDIIKVLDKMKGKEPRTRQGRRNLWSSVFCCGVENVADA